MAKLEEGMEVCESCEVHENLLKIVNEKMPEETELYDLAELFKVFGDSTRMRYPVRVVRSRGVCLRSGRGTEYDTVCNLTSAQDPETEQTG
mgnify:CR=1 FL=1